MKKNTSNATKANVAATVFTQYEAIYNDLITCKTKRELVDTMNRYGLRTTTLPTATANVNDLYIQFNEKSRLLISKKLLKLYTNSSRKDDFKGLTFDKVNDGSYRNVRASVQKTVENFKAIFSVFMGDPNNYLPIAEK